MVSISTKCVILKFQFFIHFTLLLDLACFCFASWCLFVIFLVDHSACLLFCLWVSLLYLLAFWFFFLLVLFNLPSFLLAFFAYVFACRLIFSFLCLLVNLSSCLLPLIFAC